MENEEKKDIDLENIPKSKLMLEHINFANELTSHTGHEHGFRFCKKDKDIIVDAMCEGSECTIDIKPRICDMYDNSFHTHPGREVSELSVGDLSSSIDKSLFAKKPHISCVKSVFDKNIICKRTDAQKLKYQDIYDMVVLEEEYKKPLTYEKHEELYSKLHKMVDIETIIFDDKGKLLYHHGKKK